jgi:O-methyltransferase
VDIDKLYAELPHIRGALLETPTRLKHSVIIPFATYSPWLDDEAFMTVCKTVEDYSLIDTYRLYELWQLVRQVANVRGDILEVGVWRGGSGALIAAAMPDKWVYLCDTFTGVVNADVRDSSYQGGEHADTSPALVQSLLDRLGCDNAQVVEGVFPNDTAHLIRCRKLAFAHIDVDVYESARLTMEWVWPRLSVGGMVVFDDYGFQRCDGITALVNERRSIPGSLTIYNLNGHAIVLKLKDLD